MMFCRMLSVILAFAAIESRGAVKVTASREYVDRKIAEVDTSYQRFDVATNINQSVQYVTNALEGVLNIKLPTGSKTKDWVMYCNFQSNTAIHLPLGTWWMADSAYTNAIPANQPTALYFTQVTDGVYMLSRQELAPVKVEEE